ncbi:MAG: DUF58 domain-containing protein [Gemmatimonadota bacterium]
MIIPSRRWLLGAAFLALVAPLALVWPAAATWLVVLDAGWLLLLAVEGWRAMGVEEESFTVRRLAPPAFSLRRALPVTYRWESHLPRAVDLRVAEELPAILSLGAAQERALRLAPSAPLFETHAVTPLARGKGGAGVLHLRVLSPWHMVWRSLRVECPWEVTVFPTLVGASLRALPTQSQRRREAGLRAVRRLGEGRVFESLREWVPGDDSRTIDWKATARRRKPMVRQYEDERRQQVLIVVDAGRMLTAEHDGRARLEYVVEAALQLAHSAVDHDDNVGLMVFADTIQQYLAPSRGRRALRGVLDALATVRGALVEPDYPAAFAYLAQRNRKRALTVVFTDIIDRTASEALMAHVGSLRPRHLPLAVAMRDPALDRLATRRPATGEEAFQRAAAEELLQSREAALSDMRGRGVIVLDVPPASAAEAVVAQYNLLKRRATI